MTLLPRAAGTAVLLAFVLALAGPVQAIYIETPLRLTPDRLDVEAGDELQFVIAPNPDNHSYQYEWAGKTVHVRFSYDRNAGGAAPDPDAPVSDDGYTTGDIRLNIVLDANATASLSWVVPNEVQHKNVDVFVESEDGERLAFAYLAIGDAPPVMRITSGDDADGREPGLIEGDGDETAGAPTQHDSNAGGREAPPAGIFGILLLLAGTAVALTVLARRA